MTLRIKNWKTFQHYRDRKPPWLKLHRGLLDDFAWHQLPDASMALAPMLWLLASEYEGGEITASDEEISFRLHRPLDWLAKALEPLLKAGFVELVRDASTTLAPPEQPATSESEAETQVQTEEERESTSLRVVAVLPEPDDLSPPLKLDHRPEAEALRIWNEAAERIGLPIAQRLTDPRRKALKSRLSESGGMDGWRAAVAKVEGSSFLTGKCGRTNGHENWRCDLDFILRQAKFTKLMEGGFDDTPGVAPQSGLLSVLAALGPAGTG